MDSTGTLVIPNQQGRLVRLRKPAASVFIANPEIADVSVKSARMVYV
ncbi:MAG: type II and III secretion system protein family protein, partial [Alphaproteobacteria bacterium]